MWAYGCFLYVQCLPGTNQTRKSISRKQFFTFLAASTTSVRTAVGIFQYMQKWILQRPCIYSQFWEHCMTVIHINTLHPYMLIATKKNSKPNSVSYAVICFSFISFSLPSTHWSKSHKLFLFVRKDWTRYSSLLLSLPLFLCPSPPLLS